MTERLDRQRARFDAAGQGHVLRFVEELDDAARERLLDQLEAVDLALVDELGALLNASPATESSPVFEPPGTFPLQRSGSDVSEAEAAAERGRDALRAGRVGYVLVAGGQASRLGYSGPKGLFPVGPVSGRVLFDIHARRLLAAKRRYDTAIHWYVMTSAANDAQTRAAFEEAGYYGLDANDVHFFSQEMIPALGTDGRILMSAKDSLFLAPNGHGGSLLALQRSGLLAHAREHDLDLLSYFQVDNPLARPADPLFIGLHLAREARMSTKVVKKRDASEKVGVIGKIDGAFGCIEYSDLSDELRTATDDSGELLFKDGNIAVHMLDVPFVDELTRDGLELPWHVARKKMKVLDDEGSPAELEGAKFETFVFDALRFSERSVTLEVDRAHEFSPVKNAEGSDSPATTRRDLCKLFAGWATSAGLSLPKADAEGNVPIEVDPLYAEHEEEFLAREPAQAEADADSEGHLYE